MRSEYTNIESGNNNNTNEAVFYDVEDDEKAIDKEDVSNVIYNEDEEFNDMIEYEEDSDRNNIQFEEQNRDIDSILDYAIQIINGIYHSYARIGGMISAAALCIKVLNWLGADIDPIAPFRLYQDLFYLQSE